MGDYLDQYFCSSSWSDMNVKERSSWVHSEPEQPNPLPPSSLGVNQDDKINSLSPNEELDCGVEHGLMLGESGPEMAGDQNCCVNFSKEMFNENFGYENLGLQFNAAVDSFSGSLSLGSSKDLPVVGDMTPSLSFIERGHVICNGGESSEFRRSFTGLESLSPIPQLWHPQQPYDSVSSLPTFMGQTRMQSSCLQGENGNVDDDDGNINRFVEIDKILQPENLSASINAKVLISNYDYFVCFI